MEQRFQVLLQVFGGLALFLYGTDSLCRAVQQGAGRRLRSHAPLTQPYHHTLNEARCGTSGSGLCT